MLPSHRISHARIWICLAVLIPAVLLVAAIVRPQAIEKEPQRLGQTAAGRK